MKMSDDLSKQSSEKDPLLSDNGNKSLAAHSDQNDIKPLISRHDSTPGDDSKDEDKSSILVIAFTLMLLFQLGNRIFGRLETFPMHNYPIFMNMLSTVIYIPICFAYIIPMLQLYGSSVISKEQQDIPKYKFGVMGFCDSLAGIMQTFAVNYISNSSTIVLVQQSAIPISMIISKLTLKAEYTKAQYWGAFVVLFGIFLVLSPSFFASCSHSSPSSSAGSNFELVWIFVLMISCVPMCLSSVYKEQALGELEINIMYLNGWVAVFQSLFAIPLCIPSARVIDIPVDRIMPNMYGGMLCWMGVNSITNDMNGHNDHCEMAPIYVSLYLFFNIVYNFLIVVILKHGSANILWMASTVIVPLSNVAFSLKFMPGSQPLKLMDILGLLVIMAGLVVYRFMASTMEYIRKFRGLDVDDDERFDDVKIYKKVTKRQPNYVGFNQIESLQTLIDSRIYHEKRKKSLFRSAQQIRGNLLVKLGIPPSPAISMNYHTNTISYPLSKRGSFATPKLNSSYVEERERDSLSNSATRTNSSIIRNNSDLGSTSYSVASAKASIKSPQPASGSGIINGIDTVYVNGVAIYGTSYEIEVEKLLSSSTENDTV